jgi:hypothetical protein
MVAIERHMSKEKDEPKEELERVSEEGVDDELIETQQQYENHVELVIEECVII